MMRPFAPALAVLLIGATPPTADVAPGVFRTWGIHPVVPLTFRSAGLTIHVTALPCPGLEKTEGCSYDGVNNQASITVSAPGVTPFRMVSDRQASFVRVAAVSLGGGRARPGVVVDNQWGGSGGLTDVTVIEPVAGGFRAVPLTHDGARTIEGQIDDRPHDLSGDGITDFVLEDGRFAFAYGCNACTPRPPLVLSVIGGRSIDLSADPAVRAVFAKDMAMLRPRCFATGDADRNGACAAYVADGARLGRFTPAWRDMLAHYDPRARAGDIWQDCRAPRDAMGNCPASAVTHYPSFPASLRAFLVKTGYITRAESAAAPSS